MSAIIGAAAGTLAANLAAIQVQEPRSDTGMLMHIIERAANEPTFDLERLEKLLDLKDRWDKTERIKAFAQAMVAFKRNPPTLLKDNHVKFTNTRGQVTEYDHATHYEVTTKISDALAQHGITHQWSMAQEQNKITVTCKLTHLQGHVEAVELFSMNDDSGGKNSIQAVASANSYLQRYTLLAVTGLSTKDMPNDEGTDTGGSSDRPPLPEDVRIHLRDAAGDGTASLADAWRALSNETRALIVTHYAGEWAALKEAAAEVTSP